MKISRRQFVKAMAVMSAASMLAACGGNSGSGSSGGKKELTFQIWDVAQKEGMEAMCAAYTQQHPDVSIEVQVTSWNEYWTKLEAAATSNQMPDIFWMHTNELLKYADTQSSSSQAGHRRMPYSRTCRWRRRFSRMR